MESLIEENEKTAQVEVSLTVLSCRPSDRKRKGHAADKLSILRTVLRSRIYLASRGIIWKWDLLWKRSDTPF